PEQIFLAEWAVLASLDGKDRFADYERERHDSEQEFAEIETRAAERLRQWRVSPRERVRRLRIRMIQDFERYFVPAFIASGLSVEDLDKVGPDGLEMLVSSVPSMFVLTELRRLRYENPGQVFRRTDLNDMRALSVAVAYCDVVVVDKAWVRVLRRSDLPSRFNTQVFATIAEALPYLGLDA